MNRSEHPRGLCCWWFGCEQYPEARAYQPPEQAECARCGGLVSYSDMVGDTRHYRVVARLRGWCRVVWPRKCPDCGHRFRACDETVNHIPF